MKDDELRDYVIVHNRDRRDLTVADRAIIAERLATAKEGRQRKGEKTPPTRKQAAKKLNVSPRTVDGVRWLKENAPQFYQDLKNKKYKTLAAAITAARAALGIASAKPKTPETPEQSPGLKPAITRTDDGKWVVTLGNPRHVLVGDIFATGAEALTEADRRNAAATQTAETPPAFPPAPIDEQTEIVSPTNQPNKQRTKRPGDLIAQWARERGYWPTKEGFKLGSEPLSAQKTDGCAIEVWTEPAQHKNAVPRVSVTIDGNKFQGIPLLTKAGIVAEPKMKEVIEALGKEDLEPAVAAIKESFAAWLAQWKDNTGAIAEIIASEVLEWARQHFPDATRKPAVRS